MINKNKIYVINMNNLSQVESFSIYRGALEEIATYLIGKRIDLHLLCCVNHTAIILKNDTYWDMIREIQHWLDCETAYV